MRGCRVAGSRVLSTRMRVRLTGVRVMPPGPWVPLAGVCECSRWGRGVMLIGADVLLTGEGDADGGAITRTQVNNTPRGR